MKHSLSMENESYYRLCVCVCVCCVSSEEHDLLNQDALSKALALPSNGCDLGKLLNLFNFLTC